MEIFSIVIVVLAICFYFLPTMIGSIRHTEHGAGIFWINLLFGWTVLGWIAALIWAVTKNVEARVITPLTQHLSQNRRQRRPSWLQISDALASYIRPASAALP
jgi:hypothetical protein